MSGIKSVIPDKSQIIRDKQLKEWPRPAFILCRCGKTAWQKEIGSPQYVCVYCSASIIAWTGFDDPAWV